MEHGYSGVAAAPKRWPVGPAAAPANRVEYAAADADGNRGTCGYGVEVGTHAPSGVPLRASVRSLKYHVRALGKRP